MEGSMMTLGPLRVGGALCWETGGTNLIFAKS